MERIGIIKLEIRQFNEKSNFFLWQTRVKDVFIQQGLIDTFMYDESPATMEKKTWRRLPDAGDEHDLLVFSRQHGDPCTEHNFLDSTMKKLKELYMAKSLSTCFSFKSSSTTIDDRGTEHEGAPK